MITNVDTPPEPPKNATRAEQKANERAARRERRRRKWALRWTLVKRGAQLLILLAVLAGVAWILRERVFVNVPSGSVSLVYYLFFGGTDHNTIGHEGLHIIAPWDTAYIYNIRTQTLIVPMTMLSKSGVEVTLDAQIRFHPIPETIPYLHRKFGPEYVNTIIRPQLSEAVQSVIGQFKPQDIYSSSTGATANRLFEDAKRIIGGVYVDVEDIALFNIKLPQRVQEAIQSKAEEEQKAEAYQFKVLQEQAEFRRKQIEVSGLELYAQMAGQIPNGVLVLKGIEATSELAKSPNAKILLFGNQGSLPLLLGNVPEVQK